MPNYDYQCAKCGKTFEVFQSMSDRRLSKCPDAKCGGKVTRLLGTGAGLLFKGSGFYITDYRSESYKQAASGERKSAADAGGGGNGGGGEAKPAAASSESKPAPKGADAKGADAKGADAAKSTKSTPKAKE